MQQRVSTTVVALVGSDAAAVAAQLGDAPNVRAVVPGTDADPLDRAVQAWRQAVGAHIPYLVHDADPLAEVADAWARRFDGQEARGELEVAAQATLTRWRAGSLELPDYYVVLDAESLPVTRRHWYLGVLHRAAPARVVPAAATDADVRAAVRGLRAGRWWPDLDRLLERIDEVVPDQVDLTGQAVGEAAQTPGLAAPT